MIKNSLKTFFKNIIYIFVPMGIVYLFFILILFALVGAAFGSVSATVTRLWELMNVTVEGAEGTVRDYFSYAFAQIDWNGNFFDTLKVVFDSNWLYNTTIGFFDTLNVTVEGFGAQVREIVDALAAELSGQIVFSLTFFALVIAFANFVTRCVIRRFNAKRNLWKKLAAWLLDSTVVVGILGLTAYLTSLWPFSPLIMSLVYVIVSSFVALGTAWVLHGGGSVRFGKAVNGKNIFKYFLSALLIILICAAAIVLIYNLLNALFAVLIAVPLLIYAGNIININADAYVMSLAVDKNSEKTQYEKPAPPAVKK